MATYLRWSHILTGLAALLTARSVAAQARSPGLYDRFQLDLSVTAVILGSHIRVDGLDGRGTDLDVEDDLGLSKTKIQPRGVLRWRPGHRHELELGYQFARRTSEKVLERDIALGDSTFEVGAQVKTTFHSDLAFLTYRFAFLAKDRTQVGLGLGLGALFFDLGLNALGNAGANQADDSASASTPAPVGSLGLYGRFLSGERWYFELDARYIRVSIDRFQPQVLEWNGAARYTLSSQFALEAGYGGTGIDIEIGPRTSRTGNELTNGGHIKYSLQNVRLGLVWVP